MYFEIYKREDGDWGFRLKGANHETIVPSEGYKNRADCEHAIDLVKGTTAETPVREV
jgi:uncharacterized protein YegP (UPF0339 family)